MCFWEGTLKIAWTVKESKQETLRARVSNNQVTSDKKKKIGRPHPLHIIIIIISRKGLKHPIATVKERDTERQRERQKETERETDKQTDRQRQRGRGKVVGSLAALHI